jgi:uncharacterized protein (DUF1697 family)
MGELEQMCEALGLSAVRTCVASGNVVFENRKSKAAIKLRSKSGLRLTATA